MITELYAGSVASSGTEYSLPNATTYSSGSGITTDGAFQVFLDSSSFGITDEVEVKIYEKCQSSSTQRVVYTSYLNYNTGLVVFPTLVLIHAWDVTIKAITGTATVEWSIRQIG